ncbi:hypothetical protein ACA910_011748 [Epithemia clementina (nom. ined.)]
MKRNLILSLSSDSCSSSNNASTEQNGATEFSPPESAVRKEKNELKSYSELKITGPPLYNQGVVTESDRSQYSQLLETTKKNADRMLLDSNRTALLIVDVQPEYWSECPAVRQDFPHFPQRLSALLEHCRAQHLEKCIWVRADYSSYEKSPWLAQFARLHQGRIPPIVKPSSKWESFAEPQPGEVVMTKTSWSSTSDTDLIDILRASNIDTVLVCGLITSVCVQHSAFGIFEAGFRTLLVTDCCADRGKARHEAALALYGDYMYELCTVASIQHELRPRTSRRKNHKKRRPSLPRAAAQPTNYATSANTSRMQLSPKQKRIRVTSCTNKISVPASAC